MERVRPSILHRSLIKVSPHNVESAALEAQAEEARVARHAARLSQHAALVYPTADEEAARKRALFEYAQTQMDTRLAEREREKEERRREGATLSMGDSAVGLVTPAQAQARAERERRTLVENQRLAVQRADARRAVLDAQRAVERGTSEWLDPRRRPLVPARPEDR